MAIERDNKLLNGEGLYRYTELLKEKINTITTSISGNITNAITTIVGDASENGNTLGKLEDRIETLDSEQNADEAAIATLIQEVYGNAEGTDPSRIDSLETAVNGITTTTIPGIQDQITALTTSLTTTYKTLQEAAELTAPAGEYISGINQTVQGVVSITTTALPVVPDASASTPGIVQMATGATTFVVYDKEQIDSMISGSSSDIGGLATRVSAAEDAIDALNGSVEGTGAKKIQAAVTSPTVGSTPAIEFIDTISQNANGDITATKQAVRNAAAGVTGVVQMASGATTNIAYDSKQVDDKIAEAVASVFKPEVVAADAQGLPDVDSPEENVIYLVPNGSETIPNYYIEYMWIDEDPEGHWEVVGNTELTIETLNTDEVTQIFNEAWNTFS